MSVLTDILIQAACYGASMCIPVGLFAILFKGFMFKYMKVRASFGAKVMVKIRTTLRDYFAVGKVIDGFIVYKVDKNERRIAINPDQKVFYRSMAVTWVDVDEEKNAACTVDYTPIPGFDAERYNNLFCRALQKPAISSSQEKLIMGLIVGVAILVAVSIFFGYTVYSKMPLITSTLQNILSTVTNKATVVGSSSVI